MRDYHQLLAYGIAIASSAIALVLKLSFAPLLSQTLGSFFYIAIIVTTWYGGFRPGLVTVVLSTLAINYFLIFPPYQFWIAKLEDLLQLGVFLLVGWIITVLTNNFRNSTQKIEQLNQQLAQERAEQLRIALSAAQMGMWNWDLKTGKINGPPEFEQLLGFTPGTFDGRYQTFQSCLHPDDRQRLNQAIEQAIQTKSIYQQEFRVLWKDGTAHWIEGRGQAFYNEVGEAVRVIGTVMSINARKEAQALVQQQFDQQRLVLDIAQRIQRSLNLQDILQTTVEEVRQLLQCDRVIIFQFSPQWRGTVVVESVGPEWTPILSTEIYDPCFAREYAEPYQEGLVTAKSDIYTAGIDPCHLELLANFQVRANLVVPIIKGEELWGLLIAHQCAAPRQWQASEIDLLRQLSAQVSIAIQQAALFAQIQTELAERKQAEAALRESEERYRTLFESIDEGFCVLQMLFDENNKPLDYRFLEINPTFEQQTGLHQAIGKTARELVPTLEDYWFEIYGRVALTGEPLRFENGSEPMNRWFDVYALRVGDPEQRKVALVFQDISERKRAEMALQRLNAELEERVTERTAQLTETNHRLLETLREQQHSQLILLEQAQLLDLAHDMIMTRDLNGLITFWNQGAEQMYGWTKAEALGQPTHVFLNTQFPHQSLAEIESQLLEHGYWDGELIHTRRDGSTLTVASRWVMQRDEMGRPVKVLEINNDITVQKQAEAALQQYVLEIEDLYNKAPCGYHSLDAEGRFMRINDTELNWLGYTRDEILYRKFSEVLTAESQQVFGENFPKFKQQGWMNNLEFEIVHKDRTTRWISLNAIAIKDEAGNFLISRSSLFDVSDRKQTEEALRQSEEKFRQLAENIQAVFWMTDAYTQQVLYVSKAYETIWQRSCESLYQNSSRWLEAIHPSDRTQVETISFEIKINGKYDQQYRIVRPDGSIRWIRDRAFPIKNEAGDIIRVAGIAEDITEQQKIEQIKNEFIGIVSHELRTPLTAIQLSLGLLKTGIYNQKPDKFQRMIDIALMDTNRLVNLVNDILDLERLESGRAILEKTNCQALDLMQQAVQAVQVLATPQQIHFAIHPTDTEVWAAADAIVQTITNLLSNAIKFSPPNSTITLRAERQANWVQFQVQDHGRGIPADKLEAVFGRFQQVDASDSREKGGTGLGLAICRSIIEQHSGEIWAESTLGKGSTFFFTLPLPLEEIA